MLDGVDHILHAGDVGGPGVLTELAAIAPVSAVWGNTDGFEVRAAVPDVARVELGGLGFVVVHGHRHGTTPEALAARWPEADVVVFGHTHTPLLEERTGTWFVNPGSCGPRRPSHPVSLVTALVEDGRFAPRLVELAVG